MTVKFSEFTNIEFHDDEVFLVGYHNGENIRINLPFTFVQGSDTIDYGAFNIVTNGIIRCGDGNTGGQIQLRGRDSTLQPQMQWRRQDDENVCTQVLTNEQDMVFNLYDPDSSTPYSPIASFRFNQDGSLATHEMNVTGRIKALEARVAVLEGNSYQLGERTGTEGAFTWLNGLATSAGSGNRASFWANGGTDGSHMAQVDDTWNTFVFRGITHGTTLKVTNAPINDGAPGSIEDVSTSTFGIYLDPALETELRADFGYPAQFALDIEATKAANA